MILITGVFFQITLFFQNLNLSIFFEKIFAGFINTVFYPIKLFGSEVPIVVLLLMSGGIFFTLFFVFPNIRLFPTAIKVVSGSYDQMDYNSHSEEEIKKEVHEKTKDGVDGEVSHFQALTSALSATVGLGNIAGVAIAIAIGGPGATVWMIMAGILGMSSKFVECTLGVKYRIVGKDGTVYGGPMYYLSRGFRKKGWPLLGKILGGFFAVMCVGGSFGIGNMFQANQATAQIISVLNIQNKAVYSVLIGVIFAILLGMVLIGGIKRIGKVTSKVVPFMAGIYVVSGLIIIFLNINLIPQAITLIIDSAFTNNSLYGGFFGVLVVGFQRGAFSNEAGVGTSSIAHSAVKTNYPVSEGLVALLEPFIDTVVICTMTAMVIVITNIRYGIFTYGNLDSANDVIVNATGDHIGGVELTSLAFNSAIPYFSIVLTFAVVLFAFSTLISYSYYGLQSWGYLFGKTKRSILIFKFLYVLITIVGCSASLGVLVNFADAMLFSMVLPNMIGLFVLGPQVKKELHLYLKKMKLNY